MEWGDMMTFGFHVISFNFKYISRNRVVGNERGNLYIYMCIELEANCAFVVAVSYATFGRNACYRSGMTGLGTSGLV